MNDIRKSCLKDSSDLEILEKTLVWGHITPTSPETMSCYPFIDEDPFIIDNLPDVYFAGNMGKFDYKHLIDKQKEKKVLLVCVPEFKRTKSFCLVNLNNLDVFEIGI